MWSSMQEYSTNNFASPKIPPCTISYGSKIPVYEVEMESGSTRVILALWTALSAGMTLGPSQTSATPVSKEGHTPVPQPT